MTTTTIAPAKVYPMTPGAKALDFTDEDGDDLAPATGAVGIPLLMCALTGALAWWVF